MKFAKHEGQPEIFETVQGEGRSIGAPALFARLSNCNLYCTWCDTPYTWNWEGTPFRHDDGDKKYRKEDEQLELSVGEAVDQLTGYKCKRIVITGGEPMLQQKEIEQLIIGMREEDPDFWFEIETNGTVAPRGEMAQLVNQFNVSPKLSNSGNKYHHRLRPKAMEHYAALPQADFKFVVYGEEDLGEILGIINEFKIKPEKVFLMPEGRDAETIKRRQEELVKVCIDNNFNLTTRMQVLIWGNKRGT